MKIQVILGRPAAGKTRKIINILNGYGRKNILFSFENTNSIVRSRGLSQNTISIDKIKLSQKEMERYCKNVALQLVGIDSIELMPDDINLQAFAETLEKRSCKCLLITSHLDRRYSLNSICSKRTKGLSPEFIVVTKPGDKNL